MKSNAILMLAAMLLRAIEGRQRVAAMHQIRLTASRPGADHAARSAENHPSLGSDRAHLCTVALGGGPT